MSIKTITIYFPYFGRYKGGAERKRALLAEAFVKKGFTTTILVHKFQDGDRFFVPDRVRLVDLGVNRHAYALPRLVEFIHKERPDAMLVSLTFANTLALWARRLARSRMRLVITEHNTLSIHSGLHGDWRWRLAPVLARRFYPWADGIVAVSEGAADDLANVTRISRRRITCIYNPVIDSRFDDRANEKVYDLWFCPDAPPVVLSVGRLALQKDFETLLKAFSLLRIRRRARLVILGDGPERGRLTGLVQQLGLDGDVRFGGYVENPLPYMRKARVFVLSSAWEGFGNVLVEALACGTPIVSTDCPNGPREILDGGAFGRLVPVGDVEALATAVDLTLDEEPRVAELRRRGGEFSVEKAAEQYLGLLF